ncbi:MAG: HAD family phosphatase [Steroidobacteraceae bacterium]
MLTLPWPRALLLDMDGTLIDSDEAHLVMFNEVLAPYGVTVTHEIFARVVMGGANEAIMQALLPDLPAAERAALALRKERLVLQRLDLVRASDGALPLLQAAGERSVPVAVVTNAPRENAAAILSHLNMSPSVTTLVAIEDVTRPKPHPLPYQEALRRLRVVADDALAFEDSVSGVRSAAAAGLRVIGVTGDRHRAGLDQAGAWACARRLSDVVLAD